VDSLQVHLAKCFLVVFPNLKPEEVLRANATTLEQWDSVASVTLFTLIEEEFGLSLDMDALDEFSSFERILAQIERNLA
jgi:acyl carrier protein